MEDTKMICKCQENSSIFTSPCVLCLKDQGNPKDNFICNGKEEEQTVYILGLSVHIQYRFKIKDTKKSIVQAQIAMAYGMIL